MIFLLLLQLIYIPTANAAQKITFVKGIFTRSITIKEIEEFAERGIKKGFLGKIIRKKDEEKIRAVLTKEYNAPIVLTSRLLYSEIGNALLKRISKVLYSSKLPDKSMSILAIRSGTIKAINIGKDKISIISFLKAYPGNVISIDVTELYKVLNKVESMSELMKFYSDSPLEKLKK